jgi:ribonuclease H-related protein
MTQYLYQKETLATASSFAERLSSSGLSAVIGSDPSRDYMTRITVSFNKTACGSVKVYYKPSKKCYTLDCSELKDASLKKGIETIWDGGSFNFRDTISASAKDKKKPGGIPEFTAYVDGSYMKGKTGWGVVIVKDDEPVFTDSGALTGPECVAQRQVPGEIEGAMRAVMWCEENSVSSIRIAYDYLGLEKWATGQWKTNNNITRSYAAFMKKTGVSVFWMKIKSHSGDRWNDVADELAKSKL